MTEAGWKCKKCETFNEAGAQTCNCGEKKPSFFTSPLFYAAAGGGVLLIAVIIIVSKMMAMPENKYKETLESVYEDGQKSEEDVSHLAKIQKQWNVSDEKAMKWEKELLKRINKQPENDKGKASSALPQPSNASPSAPAPSPIAAPDVKAAMVLVSDALKLVKENKLQDAVDKFSQAAMKDQDNDQAWGNWGATYVAMGRHADALDPTRKAAMLNPKNPVWHLNLAEIYSTTGDTKNALDELDSALRNGFTDREKLKAFNFKAIENDPRFKELVRGK